MQDKLRAIIYILLGRPQTAAWRRRCLDWVDRRGYELVSLIEEKPEDESIRPGLAGGLTMLTGGEAEVLVVADPAYLPEGWVPRLEVAAGEGEPFAIPPGDDHRTVGRPPVQRRPRPVHRPET